MKAGCTAVFTAVVGTVALVVALSGPIQAQTMRPKPRPAGLMTAPETAIGAAVEAAISGPVAPAPVMAVAPPPRPENVAGDILRTAAAVPAPAPVANAAQPPRLAAPAQDPNVGAVTNLPLPRYVSLKTNEGNARRGPGLTHRIDWVFTKAGMPLKITAEFENWRRVEDVDGLGGWIHYSLLSGVRTAIVKGDLVDFHTMARPDSAIAFRAEAGVVLRILSCEADWCRVQTEGERGWVPVAALWGVDPGEVIE